MLALQQLYRPHITNSNVRHYYYFRLTTIYHVNQPVPSGPPSRISGTGVFTCRMTLLPLNHQCRSSESNKQHYTITSLINWHHPFFTYHWTPGGRGVGPFTLVLLCWCQYSVRWTNKQNGNGFTNL